MKWERFGSDTSFLVLGEERRSYCALDIGCDKADNKKARENLLGSWEREDSSKQMKLG